MNDSIDWVVSHEKQEPRVYSFGCFSHPLSLIVKCWRSWYLLIICACSSIRLFSPMMIGPASATIFALGWTTDLAPAIPHMNVSFLFCKKIGQVTARPIQQWSSLVHRTVGPVHFGRQFSVTRYVSSTRVTFEEQSVTFVEETSKCGRKITNRYVAFQLALEANHRTRSYLHTATWKHVDIEKKQRHV